MHRALPPDVCTSLIRKADEEAAGARANVRGGGFLTSASPSGNA